MEQCGRVSELVHGGFITSHNGDKKVIYPSENKYGRDDLEEEVSKEFLAPTLEESYISECLSVCLWVTENSSILTSNLNISAPDQLIQMKFGSFINLRL